MKKDIKLSNIKGLLIFLVVFGHLLELYKIHFNEIFLLIYAFHMPLFIFVSGYFAKRVSFEKVINLFLIYIIFQTIYSIALTVITNAFNLDYSVPFFHLWYLVSMVIWYLVALVILKIKPNFKSKVFIFSLIVVVGVLSRFYTEEIVNLISEMYPGFYSYTFSYQRTLSFAPYFFLGFFINQETMKRLYLSFVKYKVISILSVALFFVYFFFTNQANLELMFRGSYGTERLTPSILENYLKVGITYFISLWLSYSLINFVNNKETFLTKWGDNSLTIFLFHTFFVLALKEVHSLLQFNSIIIFIILGIVAIGITVLLSSKLFVSLTSFICNPLNTLKGLKLIKIKSKEVTQ